MRATKDPQPTSATHMKTSAEKNGITEPQQHSRRKKTLNIIYTIHLCIENTTFVTRSRSTNKIIINQFFKHSSFVNLDLMMAS
jgi:hypothetical protein